MIQGERERVDLPDNATDLGFATTWRFLVLESVFKEVNVYVELPNRLFHWEYKDAKLCA